MHEGVHISENIKAVNNRLKRLVVVGERVGFSFGFGFLHEVHGYDCIRWQWQCFLSGYCVVSLHCFSVISL